MAKFRSSRKIERFPHDINHRDIERMGEVVREALKNSYEPEKQAILKQTYLLVLYRKALSQNDQKKVQVLLGLLNKNEEILHQLKLRESSDIRSLNFWVLEMERKGKLEELLWQVKEKCQI